MRRLPQLQALTVDSGVAALGTWLDALCPPGTLPFTAITALRLASSSPTQPVSVGSLEQQLAALPRLHTLELAAPHLPATGLGGALARRCPQLQRLSLQLRAPQQAAGAAPAAVAALRSLAPLATTTADRPGLHSLELDCEEFQTREATLACLHAIAELTTLRDLTLSAPLPDMYWTPDAVPRPAELLGPLSALHALSRLSMPLTEFDEAACSDAGEIAGSFGLLTGLVQLHVPNAPLTWALWHEGLARMPHLRSAVLAWCDDPGLGGALGPPPAPLPQLRRLSLEPSALRELPEGSSPAELLHVVRALPGLVAIPHWPLHVRPPPQLSPLDQVHVLGVVLELEGEMQRVRRRTAAGGPHDASTCYGRFGLPLVLHVEAAANLGPVLAAVAVSCRPRRIAQHCPEASAGLSKASLQLVGRAGLYIACSDSGLAFHYPPRFLDRPDVVAPLAELLGSAFRHAEVVSLAGAHVCGLRSGWEHALAGASRVCIEFRYCQGLTASALMTLATRLHGARQRVAVDGGGAGSAGAGEGGDGDDNGWERQGCCPQRVVIEVVRCDGFEEDQDSVIDLAQQLSAAHMPDVAVVVV